jgi:hypothetical protein
MPNPALASGGARDFSEIGEPLFSDVVARTQ